MADTDKIDYHGSLQKFAEKSFPQMEVDNGALHLLSDLLNKVNKSLMSEMSDQLKSKSRPSFDLCAQKAVENTFGKELRSFAVAEAQKQIALLQNDLLEYEDEVELEEEEKRQKAAKIKKDEYGKDFESKHGKGEQTQFKAGISKLSSSNLKNLKIADKAKICMTERLLNFCKVVAEETAEEYEDEDILQPVHYHSVLKNYFGRDVFNAATAEGNKCLVLYEGKFIEFFPENSPSGAKSGWSKDTINTTNRIHDEVFKGGINSYLSQLNDSATIDNEGAKHIGKQLMTIARHVATKTSKNCRKGKIKEMTDIEVRQAVREIFPRTLEEHAIIQASIGIDNFKRGEFKGMEKKGTKGTKKDRDEGSQSKRKRETGKDTGGGPPAKKAKTSKSPTKKGKTSGKSDASKKAGSTRSAPKSGKRKASSQKDQPSAGKKAGTTGSAPKSDKRKASQQKDQPSAKKGKSSPAGRGKSKGKSDPGDPRSAESLEKKDKAGKKIGQALKTGEDEEKSGKHQSDSSKKDKSPPKSSENESSPTKMTKGTTSSKKGKPSSKKDTPSSKKDKPSSKEDKSSSKKGKPSTKDKSSSKKDEPSSKKGKQSSKKKRDSKEAVLAKEPPSKKAKSSDQSPTSSEESETSEEESKSAPKPLLQRLNPFASSQDDKLSAKAEKEFKQAAQKLDFQPGITELVPVIFPIVKVRVNKDATGEINTILQDVCRELVIRSSAKAGKKDILDVNSLNDAVKDLFPENVAQHAIAFGSRVLVSNNEEESE